VPHFFRAIDFFPGKGIPADSANLSLDMPGSRIYITYVLISAYRHKREGVGMYILGFAALFAAAINDILYSNRLIETAELIPFGLFVFFFSQAFLLSQRFSKDSCIIGRLVLFGKEVALQDYAAFRGSIMSRSDPIASAATSRS
jgi:hypothetical protein